MTSAPEWPAADARLDEMPGTPENLAELDRLLKVWRCCGAPNLCGVQCQESPLAGALARAAQAVLAARS